MFSWLKKNKAVRSLLAAFALSGASMGVSKTAEAAAPHPAPIKQSALKPSAIETLRSNYFKLGTILEGDTQFVYNDVGVAAVGCGVRLKYHADDSWPILKIVVKPGCFLPMQNKGELCKIADSDWKDKKTANLRKFPMLKDVEILTVKDVKDIKGKDLPSSRMKTCGSFFYLAPSSTVRKANYKATLNAVNDALHYHPNLFNLSPAAQWVVVDLIHSCGRGSYRKNYPKFFNAVETGRLDLMRKECTVKDLRRDSLKQALLTAAIVSQLDTDKTRSYKMLCTSPGVNFEKLKYEKFLGYLQECLAEECKWSKQHPVSKASTVALRLAESSEKQTPTKKNVPQKLQKKTQGVYATLSNFNRRTNKTSVRKTWSK